MILAVFNIKNKLKKKNDFNENVPIEPYYEGFKELFVKKM